jgi:hypothetical protein
MPKTPKDVPTKVGDRIMKRGRPGKGVVAEFLPRKGWVKIYFDDTIKPIMPIRLSPKETKYAE